MDEVVKLMINTMAVAVGIFVKNPPMRTRRHSRHRALGTWILSRASAVPMNGNQTRGSDSPFRIALTAA